MGDTAGVRIDVELVRALLAEQHPDLAGLAVSFLAEGWDNTIFRLGDHLTLRLPRRIEAAHLIGHEQRWLPGLVAGLPAPADGGLATSAPVRAGRPGCGYPWRWSVGPWLPGDIVARSVLDDLFDAAARMGRFLALFHRTAPSDAPANPYRGVPLAERATKLVDGLDRIHAECRDLGPGVHRSRIEDRWAELMRTPPWNGPPLWLHGDLHLANLIACEGRLSGVIDFGDLTSGDPATDLAIAWPLLPPPTRPAFRSAAAGAEVWGGDGIDDDTWRRAECWALLLAVSYLAGSATASPLMAVARATLAALVTDADR